MISRRLSAAEVPNQRKSCGKEVLHQGKREKEIERDRDRVWEIKHEQEREDKNPNQQWGKELGIFSMMRFDSATSSVLALSAIKSYKNWKAQNSKEKFPDLTKKHFSSLVFCHEIHHQDLKNVVGR